jgi:hypothetical protein
MDAPTCASCACFYRPPDAEAPGPDEVALGFCRRFPPQIVLTTDTIPVPEVTRLMSRGAAPSRRIVQQPRALFPMLPATGWCAEHRPTKD